MEYAHWWEPHLHWFWVLLLVFVILMLVCAASRMRRCVAGRAPWGCCAVWRTGTGRRWSETPRQILDRRYAEGEVTKEEYERIGRDLEP